jgi:hypothetical protein
MKASELVYYLQNAILAKGDHNIVVNTLSYTAGYTIENVETVKTLENSFLLCTKEPNTDARKVIKALLDPHNVEQLKIAIEHMDSSAPVFRVKLGNMEGVMDWTRTESYEDWRKNESERISKSTAGANSEIRGSKNSNKHVKKQNNKSHSNRRRKR